MSDPGKTVNSHAGISEPTPPPFPPAFWLILGISIVLRIPNLSESLWLDELWSTRYHLGSLQQLKWQILGRTHPPLHYVLMFVWIRIFGDGEISVRMPFLLMGIGSLVLSYLLALRVAGHRQALLAMFFLGLSPVHIWYSQESRPYMALAFFLLICLLSLRRMESSSRPALQQGVYFVSLIAFLMLHYFSSFLLIPLTLRCLLKPDRTKRVTLALTAMAALIFAGFIYIQMRYGDLGRQLGYLRNFTVFEFWMLCFQWFGLGNSILTIGPYDAAGQGFRLFVHNPEYLMIHILLLIFLTKGILYCRNSEDRYTLPFSFLIAPVVLMVLGVWGKSIYIERSLFFIYPLYAVFVAAGVFSIRSIRLRRTAVAFSCILSVVVLIAYYSKPEKWTVYKPNPNWAAAAEHIAKSSRTKDIIPAVASATPAYELLYYRPEIALSVFQADQETFGNWTSGKHEVFLVHNRYWSGGFQHLFAHMGRHSEFKLVETKSFKGLNVHQYVRITRGDSTSQF